MSVSQKKSIYNVRHQLQRLDIICEQLFLVVFDQQDCYNSTAVKTYAQRFYCSSFRDLVDTKMNEV